MPAFRIILGEVPNPGHIPLAKLYRPGLTVALIQHGTPMPDIMKSIPAALTFQDWVDWTTTLGNPEVDPWATWTNPNALPSYYLRLNATEENVPPPLRT